MVSVCEYAQNVQEDLQFKELTHTYELRKREKKSMKERNLATCPVCTDWDCITKLVKAQI